MSQIATCVFTAFLALLVAGCQSEDPMVAAVRGADSISITKVLSESKDIQGKDVVINAHLIRHGDGPWLADDPDNPFNSSLSIKLASDCQLYSSDGLKVSMSDYDGAPYGKAMGTFIIGDYNAKGLVAPNVPHVILKAFVESE